MTTIGSKYKSYRYSILGIVHHKYYYNINTPMTNSIYDIIALTSSLALYMGLPSFTG